MILIMHAGCFVSVCFRPQATTRLRLQRIVHPRLGSPEQPARHPLPVATTRLQPLRVAEHPAGGTPHLARRPTWDGGLPMEEGGLAGGLGSTEQRAMQSGERAWWRASG